MTIIHTVTSKARDCVSFVSIIIMQVVKTKVVRWQVHLQYEPPCQENKLYKLKGYKEEMTFNKMIS